MSNAVDQRSGIVHLERMQIFRKITIFTLIRTRLFAYFTLYTDLYEILEQYWAMIHF